jgi:hypothetical protein
MDGSFRISSYFTISSSWFHPKATKLGSRAYHPEISSEIMARTPMVIPVRTSEEWSSINPFYRGPAISWMFQRRIFWASLLTYCARQRKNAFEMAEPYSV